MAWEEGVLFCDGCGAEITGAPVLRGDKFHCCEDCAEGRECECALIFEEDRRAAGGEAPAA
jgi:hypothetical protein